MSSTNRWGLAAAGFLMQMALGAVYAWSVFRIPLARQFHWSIEDAAVEATGEGLAKVRVGHNTPGARPQDATVQAKTQLPLRLR